MPIEHNGYHLGRGCLVKNKPQMQHLYCTSRGLGQCEVTGQLNLNTHEIVITGDHNHPPAKYEKQVQEFKDDMKARVETSFRSPKSIYDAISSLPRYSEVAQFYPWDTAKSGLYKLKKQLPTITRFCQVEPIFSRPQLSSISRHENAELWTTNIHSSTGAQALIIGDERLALGLNPTYIFLSTTRGVLPTIENTQEVLFLMGKFENHVFLIASVLLTHHQQELINMAIQTLQQKYLTRPENILKISGSVDLVNAASPIFTNAEKKVSFYEINKFLIGTAIAEGIDVENNENQEILLKLACVSLLPPEDVGPGIMLIKSPLEGALLTLTHLYWNKYRSVLNEKSCYKDIDSFDDAAWLHCCKRQTLHNKRHEVIFWEYFHISLGITEDQHLDKMKIQERKRVVKTLPLRSCLNTKPRDSKSQKIQRLWTMYESQQVNLERFLFLAMQHANGFFKNLIYNKSAFLGPPIRVNEVPTVPVVEEPTVPVVVPVVPVAEEVTVPNVEEPTVPVVEEPTAVVVEEPTASVTHTAVVTRDENSDDESNSELESEEEDVDSEEDNEVYDLTNYDLSCHQCKIKRADHINNPCGHLLYCQRCVCFLVSKTRTEDIRLNCPVQQCHKQLTNFTKIFVQEAEEEEKSIICNMCMSRPISKMGTQCKHLSVCTTCWNKWAVTGGKMYGGQVRCPSCNIANFFTREITLREKSDN